MIEEQYVSFDTAKLLKEAGFDEWCCYGYNKDGNKTPISLRNSTIEEMFNSTGNEWYVSAPTQALAARWLREAHGIHVSSNIFMDSANDADGNTVDEWNFWSFDLFDNSGRIIEESDDRYDSYEEALEVGIREAIKLIKK